MMRTRIAAAAVVASMLGGAGIGFALSVPGTATAQAADSSETTKPTKPAPQWMADALKKLVDAGTINQAQADAVVEALREAKPARGPGRHLHHHRGPGKGKNLAVAAAAIGIGEAELRAELRAGKSIAEVARAHDVDVQKVIDALVADEEARLAQAVKNGRITQEQADRIKAGMRGHVTAHVNGTFRDGGRKGAPSDADEGTPNATPSSNATTST